MEEVDIEKLPDAVPRGNFKPTQLSGEATYITIDLETTDLIRYGQMPHITQIAASNIHSGASLDIYVKPKLEISSEAQRITGICMKNSDTMTVKGTVVQHVSIQSAIEKLCTWLEKFSNVVLVAHNGRRVSALMCSKTIHRFFSCVSSLIDSLPVFKKLFPNQSHRQEDLALALLGIRYDAHNAIADVETLGKLLVFTRLSDKELLMYSFPPAAIHKNILFNTGKSKNLKSLEVLVSRGICKMPTAENIVSSGLNLLDLKTIFSSPVTK
ncbi:uncharacterized protein LOC123555889 [Mercenaria mercenaria]|uniref:uncharacterized protein LOC123555889 n=1 Tax=Mercenaria mercenaria TaxID=6596 RepID=UPI00234FA7CF|nr:uncharacterized protein LOC123555889 [Mercenaria mercenaria]XP_053381324.1 uncharacterized protein LOC123555889 [Mercenaria mercenaria]XP_053381325.1 uncharacterized protein LOC123555889 [Mercenaria mercenaria]